MEVSLALLVFTGIIGLTMAFGWCYRNSTLDKTFMSKEKLLAQKQVQKSQEGIDMAKQRNAAKRAEYEAKFGPFKD